jgi:uncharacterized membrane protein YccC
MGVTLAVGLLTHQQASGVLAAFGAMYATFNDRDEPQRLRTARIGTAVLASAGGMTLGAALQVARPGWWLLPALTAVAYLCGAISTLGPLASSVGVLLMVSCALGSGITLPNPAWTAPPLILAGGGLVLLLTSLRRPDNQYRPQRRAVAAVFTAQADLLHALGTTEALPTRRTLTAALTFAQDTVILSRPRVERPEQQRLRLLFQEAVHVTEAATSLLWFRRAVPPAMARAPHALADAVLAGRPTTVALPDWQPDTPAATALAETLRAAARTAAAPMPITRTASRQVHDPVARRLRSQTAVISGLRLALCIAAASGLSLLLHDPRSYWLPLTVAFVLKPDLGSVFARAIHRSLGTVLGVLVAAAALAVLTSPWALIAIATLCAALLPVTVARHYALNTMAATPVVLVLVQLGGGPGIQLLGSRLVDTMLGSLIVLLLGYALWPQSRAARITPRLTAAVTAVRAYLTAVAAEESSAAQRGTLRRTAYRALADAHRTLDECLSEPPPTARHAESWLPATHALEQLTDAVSATATQIKYGGPRPSAAETRRLRAALDKLEQTVRQHHPPPRASHHPTQAPDSARDPSMGALKHALEELESALS